MPHQLALCFDEAPVTCPAQERYHTIAPILSGKCSPAEQAERLNLGYSTVTRWIRKRVSSYTVTFKPCFVGDYGKK
jgi:hypothetical protein